MNENEKILWEGTPSQAINFRIYFICAIIILLLFGLAIWIYGWIAILAIVPLGYAAWKWFSLKCHKYELTDERLTLTTGILSKQIEEMELYRIRDYSVLQPFSLRLFALGTIILKTSDKTMPEVFITGIKNFIDVKDKIRDRVEILRKEKEIREIDYE